MGTLINLDITNWVDNLHEESIQYDKDILDDNTPKLGMKFENEEVAYNFYNEYARRIGFGIRREYRNISKKDGVMTSRKFSCHKEGQRSTDKRDNLTKDCRAETRTNCQAQVTITLDRKVGMYKVTQFTVEHNHPLQPPGYVHMISSQRHITESQAKEIETADDCGLSIRDFNEYMARKAGGRDNLGFIKLIPEHYILKRWTRDARRGCKEVQEHHKEVDVKAHFTDRYRELCPRIENLVNRACECHETYMFMSKVCEESANIIEQMLAKRQCVGEQATDSCHISISMTSGGLERNAEINDYSCAKGIKKRQCPYKARSRPKSWVEKSNRKANAKLKRQNHIKEATEKENNENRASKTVTTTKLGPKKKQQLSQVNLVMPLNNPTMQQSTDYSMLDKTDNLTFTQLLTETMIDNPETLLLSNIMASQYNPAN